MGKSGECAEEAEVTGLERSPELLQEEPSEQPRQHPHRQEEAGSAANPARAVQGQPAAGDEAVNMRMVLQVLGPGMEHADETDLGAEMARIGGDRGQRFGRRLEQDGVHGCLVLEGDFCSRGRQRKDDVEIGHRHNSACRSATHAARAGPWHFGQ